MKKYFIDLTYVRREFTYLIGEEANSKMNLCKIIELISMIEMNSTISSAKESTVI